MGLRGRTGSREAEESGEGEEGRGGAHWKALNEREVGKGRKAERA